MASIDRPVVLLLSLAMQTFFDESYSSLINSISKSAQLKRVKTASGAIQYLEANNPRSILVTDEGLAEKENSAVLDKVVSYAHNGGLVIVGLHFPCFLQLDLFDEFFNAFGLPWQLGDYTRSDFQFNPSCSLPTGVASDLFPTPFRMKALHVKNARPHEKISAPTSESSDQAQSVVVGAKVGNGYLAYIGDVNPGAGLNDIILSLLGLS